MLSIPSFFVTQITGRVVLPIAATPGEKSARIRVADDHAAASTDNSIDLDVCAWSRL